MHLQSILTSSISFCLLLVFGNFAIGNDEINGDELFDQDKLLEINIELDDEDWKELCKQTRNFFTFLAGMPQEKPYTYFKATVWINGVKVENV